MVVPYYEEAGIVIYHGDCREILPQLPVAQVIVTDIPYNCSQKSNGLRQLDYGDWDKNLTLPKFYQC